LISTGLESLDARMGLLAKGDILAFFGPGAAGKSVLGLHFLIDGLEHSEPCVLITRDEPAMIDSRAMFLGYSAGRLTEHPRLQLVRLPQSIPSAHGKAPGEALTSWLEQQMGGTQPRRIVVDSVEWLAEYSHAPQALLSDLLRFLRSTGAAVYMLVRTDRSLEIDSASYGGLLEQAAGVFKLEVSERGERRFLFHASPKEAFRTDPFSYSLRAGAGLSEEHAQDVTDLDPADRRRLVIVDADGTVSAEVLNALGQQFELVPLRSAAGALSTLSAGKYGALLIAVDPYDHMRAFDLAFALRKGGNAAPIIFIAPSRGLRSSTRSRGLRVGGDDFFVAELPAAEIVDRIHVAWSRGRHRHGGLSQVGQIVQPVTASGQTRPMTESEFRQAMDTLLSEQPALFFCYLEFRMPGAALELVWPALRTRVRVGDGDILGQVGHDRFGCVLDRITPEQTERVVERIRAGHPMLQNITDVVVIASPIHAAGIRVRLGGAPETVPADNAAAAGTGVAV
jgi:KaiC/GvpD/RAD55 family RecA-like ATPase/DNA-binding response OmpR family regulator